MLEVAWRTRAKTGSRTLNAADGQPRVGITDNTYSESVMPFHWQSNDISFFGNMMLRIKKYQTKHEYTFDMDTRYNPSGLQLFGGAEEQLWVPSSENPGPPARGLSPRWGDGALCWLYFLACLFGVWCGVGVTQIQFKIA